MAWLPVGFVHPASVEVMDGYHLRPMRAADVDLDYPAVMGSEKVGRDLSWRDWLELPHPEGGA
jgi:hypothetical protein